jgi:hypothetical protein
MEVTGRRERKRKQLLDDIKEERGYWKLTGDCTRSHSIEILFGRVLDLCKIYYGMNVVVNVLFSICNK